MTKTLEQDNTSLSQADERMAVLGKLTARVAHELNNPLDGMLRYISLSLGQINQNPQKVEDYLKHIQEGLNELSSMVASILEFSRSENAAEQYVTPEKILEDAIRFLEISTNKDINIVRQYQENIPPVLVGNLGSVFSNIIKNAIQVSPENGKIIIASKYSDETLTVTITDNGGGIPEEYMNDIFKPFFTTKSSGQGTGLGLAICKEIIEKRKGTITAENTADGCVFKVTIPITDDYSPDHNAS